MSVCPDKMEQWAKLKSENSSSWDVVRYQCVPCFLMLVVNYKLNDFFFVWILLKLISISKSRSSFPSLKLQFIYNFFLLFFAPNLFSLQRNPTILFLSSFIPTIPLSKFYTRTPTPQSFHTITGMKQMDGGDFNLHAFIPLCM